MRIPTKFLLSPKVKAFGFNKKELMSVAAKIADNLTLAQFENLGELVKNTIFVA